MGMVLPEGVLNTSNLQRVRDYFEGRAKIIFICSIPQDVFVAAGATVKPSLVFFKRFTEEEEKVYAECKDRAYNTSLEKYRDEIDKLNAELEVLTADGKGRTKQAKEIRRELDDIHDKAENDSKPLIKEYFDYEIPIARVDDAGITSTGAISAGNQLPKLEEEYTIYRRGNKLWAESGEVISYMLKGMSRIVRQMGCKEVTLHVC